MCPLHKINEVTYSVDFALDATEIYDGVRERVASIASGYPLKGFRNDRARIVAVERLLGLQLRQDVIQELLLQSFLREVESLDMDIIGNPEFSWQGDGVLKDSAFRFMAVFETYPHVDLEVFRSLDVDVPECTLDMAYYRYRLDGLRKKFARWVPGKTLSDKDVRVFIDVAFCEGDQVRVRRRRIEILVTGSVPHALEREDQPLVDAVMPSLAGRQAGESLRMECLDKSWRGILTGRLDRIDGIRIFVTKLLELHLEDDDRTLLATAGFGNVPGLDPWNEFRQGQELCVREWMRAVFIGGLMRRVVRHLDICLPERFQEEIFQAELARLRRSLRRVDDDPVALEISELLVRSESRERVILDILTHHIAQSLQVEGTSSVKPAEGIPALLQWAESSCRFQRTTMTPLQLEATYEQCPERIRRLAKEHGPMIDVLLQAGKTAH